MEITLHAERLRAVRPATLISRRRPAVGVGFERNRFDEQVRRQQVCLGVSENRGGERHPGRMARDPRRDGDAAGNRRMAGDPGADQPLRPRRSGRRPGPRPAMRRVPTTSGSQRGPPALARRAAPRSRPMPGPRPGRTPRWRRRSCPTRTTISPARRTRSAGRSVATSASCSSPARPPRRCSSSSSICTPSSSPFTTSPRRRRASSWPALPRRAAVRCRSSSSAGKATVRRWRRSSSSSCRRPISSRCASTPPKPMPTRRRATLSPRPCSPTAGSASSWSASCPVTPLPRP